MADNNNDPSDHRDHKNFNYDLNKLDFEWVAKTEDKRELHKAYNTLKDDAGFPDLMKSVEDKLKTLDPAFKRKIEGGRVS